MPVVGVAKGVIMPLFKWVAIVGVAKGAELRFGLPRSLRRGRANGSRWLDGRTGKSQAMSRVC